MKKSYKHLDQLLSDHKRKRALIRKRLADFRAITPHQYFYELAYCFMTPQSSAVNAAMAQQELMAIDFQHSDVDPQPVLDRRDHYIRFHRTKAVLLMKMKTEYNAILSMLSNEDSAFQKRELLVKNVKGIGYKEATHFLRNVGLNDGLAILDRHILRCLKKHNVIRSLPKSLTGKKYLSLERRFQEFADQIGISVDELDLLFWSGATGEILK